MDPSMMGDIVALNVIVKRLVARYAILTGDPKKFFVEESTRAQADLEQLDIIGSPHETGEIREAAEIAITEFFSGLQIVRPQPS